MCPHCEHVDVSSPVAAASCFRRQQHQVSSDEVQIGIIRRDQTRGAVTRLRLKLCDQIRSDEVQIEIIASDQIRGAVVRSNKGLHCPCTTSIMDHLYPILCTLQRSNRKAHVQFMVSRIQYMVCMTLGTPMASSSAAERTRTLGREQDQG
eukprot:1160826-Pelagomonas_calceolata.AAC.4